MLCFAVGIELLERSEERIIGEQHRSRVCLFHTHRKPKDSSELVAFYCDGACTCAVLACLFMPYAGTILTAKDRGNGLRV
jgi:hypothetical protein